MISVCCFFFKQKTAYEMRISDWSSDVCSSDLVAEEAGHVPHHPQKIIFLFSAMRHFAEALRKRGITVDYVTLDDPANSGSLAGELARFAAWYRPDEIHVTEAGDWRVEQALKSSGLSITWHADRRFLCSRTRSEKHTSELQS